MSRAVLYSIATEKMCRRCTNNKYNVFLKPRDCRYQMYPTVCSNCGEVRNIMTGLAFSGRCKISFASMFKRRSRY